MRFAKLIFLLLISILSTQLAFAAPQLPSPHSVTQNLDGIIAIVNNEPITQSELNAAIARAKNQLKLHHQNISDAQLKQTLLQQLINEKLQLQLAKRAQLSVSDTQLNQAINRIVKANHTTLAGLKAKLSTKNFSFADYKKALRKEILIHQVQMSAVRSKVHITQKDVQAFAKKYQQHLAMLTRYKIMDLHVPVTKNNITGIRAAKNKALALAKAWKNHQPLKNTEIKNLGWQTAQTLPTVFLKELSSMKPGDIAGPIEAPNGFHILKLVDVQNNGKTPSELELKNMVFQMKFQKAVQAWLKKIRQQSYIKIINP